MRLVSSSCSRSLAERKRADLWTVFERILSDLAADHRITTNGIFAVLTEHYCESGNRSPYTHVIVDEAQEIGVSELRFLASLIGERADGLFFTGDLGQRIFQAPFS